MTRAIDDFRFLIFDLNTAPVASSQSKIRNHKSNILACLLLTLTLAVGCGDTDKPAPTPAPSSIENQKSQIENHKHANHGTGPHEGAVADWGGGKFHVEFTVNHDKQEATVYILGDDEKTTTPIKAATILLNINDPKFQVELAAAPLDVEAEGTASRFVGKHESLGKVQEFAGTISGEVEGTPYVGEFQEEPHGKHEHKK
ncbi:MAG: hypothetical protein ACKV2Q_29790 [Planctomycetaceae bacterium]